MRQGMKRRRQEASQGEARVNGDDGVGEDGGKAEGMMTAIVIMVMADNWEDHCDGHHGWVVVMGLMTVGTVVMTMQAMTVLLQ